MIKIKNNEFNRLIGFMHSNYGINLSKKKTLVEGRLSYYLLDRGFASYMDYLDHVFADKSGLELKTLLNRLTTNHTYFYREGAHFEFMRDHLLPRWEEEISDRDLRIWSAGCSSGEEPYTIAMLLEEYFGKQLQKWDTQILATDISQKALEQAREGVFNADSIRSLPASWQAKYFRPVGPGRVQISESIRRNVVFRTLNLMEKPFPFRAKFHIIFCRNVMIYFDQPTKRQLIDHFYQFTKPGGYLLIGHAESIIGEETDYTYVRPSIYKRIEASHG